jgi:hypothetical protein
LATIRSLAYNKSFEPTARLRLAAAQLHRWAASTSHVHNEGVSRVDYLGSIVRAADKSQFR